MKWLSHGTFLESKVPHRGFVITCINAHVISRPKVGKVFFLENLSKNYIVKIRNVIHSYNNTIIYIYFK